MDPISIINLADEYKNLTVVKLKEECKKKNIRIPFKSSKDNIISLLVNYNPSNDLNNLTVEQLRKKCVENNITNCSRLKKDELIKKLSNAGENGEANAETNEENSEALVEASAEEKSIDTMTFAELKRACKKRDIKNFSKLKKGQLVVLLTTGEYPSETENKSSSDTEPSDQTEADGEAVEKTIENMSFFELKKECKRRDIKNYSKLNKEQLVVLLTNGELQTNETSTNEL